MTTDMAVIRRQKWDGFMHNSDRTLRERDSGSQSEEKIDIVS